MYVNSRNLVGHTTGVQRYTKKILEYWDEYDYEQISPDKNFSSGLKGHMWEQLLLPLRCTQKKNLWSPSNTGPLFLKNQIVTIHDTVPFDHPEWLNPKFTSWYKFLQPKLAKNVKHIITISEFSKQRIMECLKVPENKISVIYNGVDLCDSNLNVSSKFDYLDNYILSVGSLEPRKNISRLISAFLNYKKENCSDLKLVIVGQKGFSRVFNKVDFELIDDDIIFTGHVSDNELKSLYKKSKGFCYPSLYEGFGLPPLEAMHFSIPVLTSDNSAMKELCNGKAILVDPYSVESISQGIYDLLNNKISYENILNNKIYVESLSWKKCSEQTYNILENFI